MSDPALPGPVLKDLTIRYEWIGDSVPPPYHYEYAIRVSPGGAGEVTFYPDYSQHDPPVWRETFAVDEGALDALLAGMERAGVFSRRWRRAPRHIVGGSLAWLEAVSAGRKARVPAALPPRSQEAIAPVYEAIRALVPQAIWDGLMARYHQFQGDHREW